MNCLLAHVSLGEKWIVINSITTLSASDCVTPFTLNKGRSVLECLLVNKQTSSILNGLCFIRQLCRGLAKQTELNDFLLDVSK